MISLVTSLYRSAPYIEEFHRQHVAVLKDLGIDDYEFVFVDDGSPDNSAAVATALARRDARVRVVLLSKNFGQYPAMFAGLAHARGDIVYTMDCDLEEDPRNLAAFLTLREESPDLDFIFGEVDTRSGGAVRGWLGGLFFKLMNAMSDVRLHENISWQILMSRRYVDNLLRFNELETLPGGLMVLTGFAQRAVPIQKTFKGTTTYPLSKRVKLAVNSITAFSSKPLVFIGLLGIGITGAAFLGLLLIVVLRLFFFNFQTGWISLIASIWLVGGLILSSIGVVGIYLAKVFNQVKGRPLYIVKEVIQADTCA